jgi:hypothetical protein
MALERGAFGHLARRLLIDRAGEAPGLQALSSASLGMYDDLSRVMAPLIGPLGVEALTSRALHLAQRDYPWLVTTPKREQAEGRCAQVISCLEPRDPAAGIEALAAVFGLVTGLLATFIGEDLTMGLLQNAWPDAFAGSGVQETKA